MGKIRIVILKDTRPTPKWAFPRRAVAIALGCQPADPRVAAVRDEALVALATFRRTEHWHDRVSLIQRVRALGVIQRALGVAEEQHSQLDPYTRSWLSRDDFRFGQRILELRQALDSTVTGLAGPGTTAADPWAIASRSARRRPPLRARDLLVVTLADVFERTATIPMQSVVYKQYQHAFVLSVLKANGIACPEDYDAFARIRRRLPIPNLQTSFIRQESND